MLLLDFNLRATAGAKPHHDYMQKKGRGSVSHILVHIGGICDPIGSNAFNAASLMSKLLPPGLCITSQLCDPGLQSLKMDRPV